jgi:hypothetical protein
MVRCPADTKGPPLPILLSLRDLDEVFDDPAFMEQRFCDVQDLLAAAALTGPDRARIGAVSSRIPLRQGQARLSVRVHGPDEIGYSLAMRYEPVRRSSEAAPLTLILAADDGAVLGLIPARLLDCWHMAVPSGLAARYLSPQQPRSLVILGAGERTWPYLRVLTRALPSTSEVRIVGQDRGLARDIASAAHRRTGLTVLAEQDPARATAEADVVTVVDDALAPYVVDMAPGTLLVDHGTAGAAMLLELGRSVSRCALAPGPEGRTGLLDIISGHAATRSHQDDIACYEAGQISDWEARLATSSLWQAWRSALGTSFQLEFAAPS